MAKKKTADKDFNVFVKLGVKGASNKSAETYINVVLARALGNKFERFEILASRSDDDTPEIR